jgi:hypothetical protein
MAGTGVSGRVSEGGGPSEVVDSDTELLDRI